MTSEPFPNLLFDPRVDDTDNSNTPSSKSQGVKDSCLEERLSMESLGREQLRCDVST